MGCGQTGEESTRPAGWQAKPVRVSWFGTPSERGLQAGRVQPVDPAQPPGLGSKAGDSCPFPLSTFLLRKSGRKPRPQPSQALAHVQPTQKRPHKITREHAELLSAQS